jgi:hypothetical protein
MAQLILFDEFRLSVLVPEGLKEAEYEAIRQTLEGTRFQAELRRVVRQLIRSYPHLKEVRVRLSG